MGYSKNFGHLIGSFSFVTEIQKAMQTKEIKDAWAALGAEMGGEGPEPFAKLIDGEVKRWAKVVKDSGAKLD